ncbi:unnamed protein product [Notodromas monacha]|uniref:Nudix hydrolase domain-containing protein n=1 Tax=Notodromas monacha TaxID=399045 RepID=A0A7R9GEJ7_9CRUS|nr:unnamed protein product [Notodromas monacha]CAG0919809.1 unnamed protein product [Notodromas monacha]
MSHLSSLRRANCMQRVKELSVFRLPAKEPKKHAAVLVPLCKTETDQLSLLYTLRSSSLRSHSGQVCFPGGTHDEQDADLIATALRETEEEIGLQPNLVEPWGFLPKVPSKNFEVWVHPVIAEIRNLALDSLRVNRDEVEQVFLESLDTLCDEASFSTTDYKIGRTVLTMPVFQGEHHKIWGLTAVITFQLLMCLVPERFSPQMQLLSGKNGFPMPPSFLTSSKL